VRDHKLLQELEKRVASIVLDIELLAKSTRQNLSKLVAFDSEWLLSHEVVEDG
jgi:hypothetical protein